MRSRRKLLGLTRVDLYAHPADHGTLKQLAAKLRRERAKTAASERQ